MNGVAHNVHYHNSMGGLLKEGKYRPSTAIKTEKLTDKYTIKNDIGRGKFAVVRKCVHNETGEEVAAKFIRKRRKGKTCRDEILREVVMLEMGLEHPRLVDLKEVFETQTELILITEYCAGGELFTECVIEESFNESDVIRFLRQILEGLVYLHERNIVHLDLKPQNILFTKPFPDGDIKVCDLGFACLVNTGEDIRDIIGTPDYVAPEVLSYEPLGLYTDMWSLGVLTYVMLTAHSPFAGKDNQETFLNISQVNLEFPESLFSGTSSLAQDFIQKLLLKEPEDRMTAQQCLQHAWLVPPVNPEKVLEVDCQMEVTNQSHSNKSTSQSSSVKCDMEMTNQGPEYKTESSNQNSNNKCISDSDLNKENTTDMKDVLKTEGLSVISKESLIQRDTESKNVESEREFNVKRLCSEGRGFNRDPGRIIFTSTVIHHDDKSETRHRCTSIEDWGSGGEVMELTDGLDENVSFV